MKHVVLCVIAGLALVACGPADDRRAETDDRAPLLAQVLDVDLEGYEPVTITWDHLLPDGELARIEELYLEAEQDGLFEHFGGQAEQIGTFNVEESLIGETVRMPGFVLPLDFNQSGQLYEFLLVPYCGACVHTPPPPPNQIIYVQTRTPIEFKEMWDPIWVVGTLFSDQHHNDVGNAAYTMLLLAHEPYEWE